MKDRIKLNLQRVKEQEEEAIRLEEERIKTSAPLITKDDLVGALGQIMQTNTKEVKTELENEKARQTKINQDLGVVIEKTQKDLLKVESKVDSTRLDLTTLNSTLQTQITNIQNETENKIKKTSEEIKNSFPKEKEYEVKDIKGLKEVISQIGQNIANQTPSQPITVDLLSAGNLVKSGVSRLNIVTGATVVQNGNTTDVSLISANATWGTITGALSNQTDLQTALDAKQDLLISGTNIKTVNGVSVLGSGDIPLPNGTSISTVTSDTTLTVSDGTTIVFVDCSSNNVNITMPTASSNTGQYIVKRINNSSNILTVVGTINGIINPTIDFENESWTMVSDGNNYQII